MDFHNVLMCHCATTRAFTLSEYEFLTEGMPALKDFADFASAIRSMQRVTVSQIIAVRASSIVMEELR